MTAHSLHPPSASIYARKHHYRLEFLASDDGVGKALEVNGTDVCDVIDFILGDPGRRTVDLWEDGEFVCSIARTPAGA